MSDEASLRKSGRTRKRPLPPDASYDKSPTGTGKSNRTAAYGDAPMPFSPDKAFGGIIDQAVAGSSTGVQSPNGDRVGDEDEEDEEPEDEPVWAELSADYYQGE